MENALQKIKDFNMEVDKVSKELQSTFPTFGFSIKYTNDIFIFSIKADKDNSNTLMTSLYVVKYPDGFDIELFKSIIDKY